MNKLEQLKTRDTDRSKINAWLDFINETDKECRDEVLELCKADHGARKYFVRRYMEDCAA